MELRHLQYVVAVVDAGGLTIAAPTHHATETARPHSQESRRVGAHPAAACVNDCVRGRNTNRWRQTPNPVSCCESSVRGPCPDSRSRSRNRIHSG
jgi:hypothetical protein